MLKNLKLFEKSDHKDIKALHEIMRLSFANPYEKYKFLSMLATDAYTRICL